MSEDVLQGSTFTIKTSTGATVNFTAATTGNTMTATWPVPSGISSEGIDIDLDELSNNTSTFDIYGATMGATGADAAAGVVAGETTITIDTTAPTAQVSTGVEFTPETVTDGDVTAAKITLKGDNFETLFAGNTVDTSADIKGQLDFAHLTWDIDGDSSNALTIGDYVETATVNSAGTEITLTLFAKSAQGDLPHGVLEDVTGFAGRATTSTSSNVRDIDNVDITNSFFSDQAGNVATASASTTADVEISYPGNTGPTISSFSATAPDGATAGEGDKITFTATMSEPVLQGSTFTAALNISGETVTFTALSDGTLMIGEYTVPSGKSALSGIDIETSTALTAVGSTYDLYGQAMTASDVSDVTGIVASGTTIIVDTTPPAVEISGVTFNPAYNAESGTSALTISGSGFLTMQKSAASDISDLIDWSKLYWDIDSDDEGTTNSVVQFTDEVNSVTLVNDTTITAVISSEKTGELKAVSGFAAAGTEDSVDIGAGFIKDIYGNLATSDETSDVEITYVNTSRPRIESFTSDTLDGTYGPSDSINIKAEVSEDVLAGSGVQVTFANGSTVDLTTDVNSSILQGTLSVTSSTTSTSDLTVSSISLETSAGATLTDLYGLTINSVTLPTGQNLSNNSTIKIDTQKPDASIEKFKFNGEFNEDTGTGLLTITGQNFDSLGVSNGGDVSELLDWTKFRWNINNDGSTNLEINAANDIVSATIINSSTINVVLSADQTLALKGTEGFANQGSADVVDITTGFFKDAVGNVSDTDAKSDIALSYQDTSSPIVTSITTTEENGTYGDPPDVGNLPVLKTIPIVVTLSDMIVGSEGAEMSLVLNTS